MVTDMTARVAAATTMLVAATWVAAAMQVAAAMWVQGHQQNNCLFS